MSDERYEIPRLDEDDRYALAARADAAERANRPRWMLGAATALLAIAAVVLLVSFGARATAESSRRSAASQVRSVKKLLREINDLQNDSPDANADVPIGERLPNLLSRMEGVARRAGLIDNIPVPSENESVYGNLRSVRYAYRLNDPQITSLMNFVKLAQEEISALGVHTLELRPSQDHWEMTVTFLRWERTP